MSTLVGDVITRVRNIAGDSCQTLQQPVAPTLAANGAGIFSGTLYGILTWLTLWGESIGSTEVSVGGLANNAVSLTGITAPIGAASGKFYYGSSSGGEQQYIAINTTGPWTVGLVTDTLLPGTPPYKSSAYLPDTDGDIVSVYEFYRWINAGMLDMGRRAGGIVDQTGVVVQQGAAEFVIPGWWLEVKFFWHNGWQVVAEQQSYTWLQSPVQGIPGIATLWKSSAVQVFGLWPQPSTAAAGTVLSAPMAAGDTQALVIAGSGFTAPGLAQIDNEIMSYSQSSPTSLTQMVRGYGGSVVAAHAIGATVNQAIFRILGYRMPTPVAVGSASMIFDMPQGWDEVLDYYLLSKFKATEQNTQEAEALRATFEAKSEALQVKDIPLKSKQVGGIFPLGANATTLAETMDFVIVN